MVNPTDRHSDSDTIVAIATAAGKGGVGIVRLSGPKSLEIAVQICGKKLSPRKAIFSSFSNAVTNSSEPTKQNKKEKIDEGIALFFPGPNSFTGEDVVELQAHGGPIVLGLLVDTCIAFGARAAGAGEFSERAFLNDKMDLTQAEAIADLIDASTKTAAKAAARSLEGVFSKRINELQQKLTEIRVFVEAAIDFPEEEIDFLKDQELKNRIGDFQSLLAETKQEATRGALLNEGAKVAIVGRPNAGKSSLMNCLARRDIAIVTDIAGTTRDSIEQKIELNGIPITLVDTAGLNDNPDQVEEIGIQRSKGHAADADLVLIVFDSSKVEEISQIPSLDCHQSIEQFRTKILGEFSDIVDASQPTIYVANKIDLSDLPAGKSGSDTSILGISAVSELGIDALLEEIESILDIQASLPLFSARSRHISALNNAADQLQNAVEHFNLHASGELFAEDLRAIQHSLSDITGSISADDLLGEIFSNFCIGK